MSATRDRELDIIGFSALSGRLDRSGGMVLGVVAKAGKVALTLNQGGDIAAGHRGERYAVTAMAACDDVVRTARHRADQRMAIGRSWPEAAPGDRKSTRLNSS